MRRRSSVLLMLLVLMAGGLPTTALAVTRDADPAATSEQQQQMRPAEPGLFPSGQPDTRRVDRMELVLHALAATCIRHPNGQGLAAAVAPGQPFSLPPMGPKATRKLASVNGALGWVLPEVLGKAALILRPNGSCSVLVRESLVETADPALKQLFERLENLRLVYLDKTTCMVNGVPTVTRTYSMIPAQAEKIWGQPVLKVDDKGIVQSKTWRGFLLAVSARRNSNARFSMVMTTFIGHYVVGQNCRPDQEL